MTRWLCGGGRWKTQAILQWAPITYGTSPAHNPNPPIIIEHYIPPPTFNAAWCGATHLCGAAVRTAY